MPREISSDNSLAIERMRAEARRRAEEVSQQSAETMEKTQTRNVPAGFGGENTVSYLTGDGDVVGATGQVTPVLDNPEHTQPAHQQIRDIEAMAASTRTDQAAGSLLGVRDMLSGNNQLTPAAVTDIQKRMGMHALQLIVASDASPDAMQRIDGHIGKIQQLLAGGTADLPEMDSVMRGLDAELASNNLKLRGTFQEYAHKKLEVRWINHMVDDASNGFMGPEWNGDGLNEMLESYGVDLKLAPDQLQMFTDLVNQIDGDKGQFSGKSNDEQRRLFMEETIGLLLGNMDVDIPIDIESFTRKVIDVFNRDFDSSVHRSHRGGYQTTAAENSLFEKLLVEELGAGARLAAQHQQDGLNETSKIPRMI